MQNLAFGAGISRKDATGAKTQSLVRILLGGFAPFASLRETKPGCGRNLRCETNRPFLVLSSFLE